MSALIIFCTFWLTNFQQFGGISVGYAAFLSVMLVLVKFAAFIAFADGSFAKKGVRRSIQVVLAGFFKFIAPPLVIYWGINRGFSPVFIALGLTFGLIAAVLTLVIFNRVENARTAQKIV